MVRAGGGYGRWLRLAALLLAMMPLVAATSQDEPATDPLMCEHPWPCADDWPDGLEGPFELAEVRHEWIELSDGVQLESWTGVPALPEGVAAPSVLAVSPYLYTCYANPVFGPACLGGPDDEGWWDDPPSSGVLGYAEGTNAIGVPPIRLVRAGYAVTFVSLPGTGNSGGCLDDMGPHEQRAVVESIDWVAAQPWSNGRVGMLGKSYLAQTAAGGLALGSEALKTAVMSGMVTDRFTMTGTPQGAVYTTFAAGFPVWGMEMGVWPDPFVPDRVPGHVQPTTERFCEEAIDNVVTSFAAMVADDRDADFWAERRYIDRFDDVTASVLMLQGFKDAYGHRWQEDQAWEALTHAPKRQVEGQWGHDWPTEAYAAQWAGTEPVPAPPWWGYSFDQLLMDWLDFWLKGEGGVPEGLGTVDYRDTAGEWRRTLSWPPADAQPRALYLSGEALGALGEPGSRSYDTAFNPVDLTRSGTGLVDDVAALDTADGAWATLCPDAPQAATGGVGLANRTAPVDRPVTIAGNPYVELTISSDEPAGLLDLRLYDLGPDFHCDEWGKPIGAALIDNGVADLRFHDGSFVATDFPVDQPTPVRVDFSSMAHRLEPGHQLALVASPGSAPVIYQSGLFTYPTITIHDGADVEGSRFVVPIVEGSLGGGPDQGTVTPRPNGPQG